MNNSDILKEIKTKLRLSMNGAAASDMRSHGYDYHLNFGIEATELKRIAADYTPDCALACALWKENIRECRILATILMPAGDMDMSLAELWLEDVEYPDLAEQLSFNLLRKTSFAGIMAFRWIASQNVMGQYCGYLIIARLIQTNGEMNPRYRDELIDQAQTALKGDNISVCMAAQRVLELLQSNAGQL